MKLASYLLSAAVALATCTHGNGQEITSDEAMAGSISGDNTAPSGPPNSPIGNDGGGEVLPPIEAGPNPLDGLTYNKIEGQWNMAPVRVVHARVQGDTPVLREGRFVSQYGDGLEGGYLSGMDSVNTASVDGALMYVQAEGIDVKRRAKSERCQRKYGMRNIVFYEILIAQTNETIAQFQDSWSTPEYGPMIPMDGGRCTPLKGDDELPVECYQFNGEKKHPDLGPFIGGESKELDNRAPYPGNYWFSFPNTCPTKGWGKKSEECIAETRKGLCPIDVAPNGVDCTFAYNILGWVPIDDVVGITSIMNEDTGKPYADFEEWCEASEDNIEFEGDSSFDMAKGLDFWSDPKDKEANQARAAKVVQAYQRMLMYKNSTQVNETTVASFRPLPSVESLAEMNPPCFESVASCGSGSGCKRVGHAQLCTPCSSSETCPTAEEGFEFPELEKAFTKLDEKDLTTDKKKLDDGLSENDTDGDSYVEDGKADDEQNDEENKSENAAVGLTMALSGLVVSAVMSVML